MPGGLQLNTCNSQDLLVFIGESPSLTRREFRSATFADERGVVSQGMSSLLIRICSSHSYVGLQNKALQRPHALMRSLFAYCLAGGRHAVGAVCPACAGQVRACSGSFEAL